MAIGDVFTLRVVGRYQAQNIVNTLHYQITDQAAGEQNILESFLDSWDTNVEASWVARHLDTYELIGLKAFADGGAAKTPAFLALGTPGSVVGEEVPAAVCRTITLYTESANSRRRGRVMLSGTAVSQLETDDGSVTAAEVALLTALGETLTTTLSGGGDEAVLCIPANATAGAEIIVDSRGRVTPALISSRRIDQFLIG